MDQPWYRQYFWLLVLGGIILFAGIISLIMVCVCRTQFSRRLTVRIQKSLKLKKKRTKENKNTVIKESYRPKLPPRLLLPEARTNLYDTNPENSSSDLRHFMYATALKRPAPTQQLHSIPENPTSEQCHITYATAQRRLSRSKQLGLTPEYGKKTFNINVNESGINDRYSNASYDSVGQIAVDMYRIHSDTEAPEYGGKKFNRNLNESGINDRYSNASYDSVGQIAADMYHIHSDAEGPPRAVITADTLLGKLSTSSLTTAGEYPPSDLYHITSANAQKRAARIQQLGLTPEYGGKTFNIHLNESAINDRYSNASYDSVGQITDTYRIHSSAEDDSKNMEYVEVIVDADADDYDDVEII